MLKFAGKLAICLTLSSMLFLDRTSGQEIPKPAFYGCLSRSEKEMVAVCFEENSECHETLHQIQSESDKNDLTYFAEALVIGILAGMVINHNL